MQSQASKLRTLLEAPGLLRMPCCFDALSAQLIERAGFALTFMSGFAVSAARIGEPDTGLISYGEMLDQGRSICAAVSIPVIGDADTGYGNPINVQRTVTGYARAGFAAAMIEDQLAPKRCGHTEGKSVVDRDEAFARIRAAVEARDAGADVLILARTDARATHGLDEAILRARTFAEIGADILFVEAPRGVDEMRRVCAEVPGAHLANMVHGGSTPILPPAELEAIGYRIAAYPVALLSAAVHAMNQILCAIAAGEDCDPGVSFAELRDIVGFDRYDAALARFARGGTDGGR